MKQRKEIETIDDIVVLVNAFYEKIKKDDLIGPIFIEHVHDDWPGHLSKMYRFWQTVTLEEETYFGSPFPPHMKLNIDSSHFKRWLALFSSTVDELFEGTKATEIKWRAGNIADLFLSKLKHLNDRRFKDLL